MEEVCVLLRPTSQPSSFNLADLQTFKDDETLALDPRIDYNVVIGLSSEVRERLFTVRPTSIMSPML